VSIFHCCILSWDSLCSLLFLLAGVGSHFSWTTVIIMSNSVSSDIFLRCQSAYLLFHIVLVNKQQNKGFITFSYKFVMMAVVSLWYQCGFLCVSPRPCPTNAL
jgi:hypothetical protein